MDSIDTEKVSESDANTLQMKEKEIKNYLTSLNIPYQIISHNPLFTMEECEKIEKEYNIHIPKNLFLANRQQTKFYLLLMPGNKPFKTKEVSSQINSARLSFGNEDALYQLLGVRKGSCTPLGLFFDKEKQVQFLLDEDILKYETIGIHPLTNTKTLIIKTKDLLNTFLNNINHDYIIVKLIGE